MSFGWIKSLYKYGFSVVSFLMVLSCGKHGSSVSAVNLELDERFLPFSKDEIKNLKNGAIVNRFVLLTDSEVRDFRNNEKIFYLTENQIEYYNEKNRFEPLAEASTNIFVCDYEYESSFGGACKKIGNIYIKECTRVMVKKCQSSGGVKSTNKIYKKITRSSINECPTCDFP